MKRVNDIRITSNGLARITILLASPYVTSYHKVLLTAIKSRMPKNVSKSDCDILDTISKEYAGCM